MLYDLIAAEPLGLIECNIGSLAQNLRIALLREELSNTDTDRCRIHDFLNGGSDPLQCDRCILFGGVRQDDRKLIAAEAIHEIARPRPTQQGSHVAQNSISMRMTELIVDELELVNVNERQGERIALALGAQHFLCYALLVCPVVSQISHRVGL